MGVSIYTSNTLHHLKELGLDSQRAIKTALKLHAHSVQYAHNLIALKVSVWSRGLPATLQIPTSFLFSFGGRYSPHFGPMCLLFLIWCRECFAACVVFLFFSFLHLQTFQQAWVPGNFLQQRHVQVLEAINDADDVHLPHTALVCLENTTNKPGGACYSIEAMQEISQVKSKPTPPGGGRSYYVICVLLLG